MSTATAGSSIASAPAAPTGPVPAMPKGPGAPAPIATVGELIGKAFDKPAPPAPEVVRAPAASVPIAPTPTPAPAPAAAKPAEAPAEPVVSPKSLLPKKTAAKAPESPAASAAPDEFDRFTLPDTASDEQKSHFTELKRISREQKAKLKELESKVNAPSTPTAEVERLRAEHKAATDRLAQLDLKSHPEFQRQYALPKTAAVTEAAQILTDWGKTGVDLEGLLGKSRKDFSTAVADLTKDLNPMDATLVQTRMNDAFRIAGEERTALANGTQLRERINQQTEAQARQTFAEVSDNLGPMGEFLVTLDTPDGANEAERQEIATYNQAVSGLRQNVEKTVFGPTNEKQMAMLARKGGTLDFILQHAVPRMERTYASLVQEHAAMARELAALKGTKGSGPLTGDPTKGGAQKQSTEDMIAATFRGGR